MRQQKQFDVIECSGTPREIGHQIGIKCRDNIAKALQMTILGLALVNNAEKPEPSKIIKFYIFIDRLAKSLKGRVMVKIVLFAF